MVCWLQRYVAVTVLWLAAMLWTHWTWTLVKIRKRENSWSCSFGFLWRVVGVCTDVSEVWAASIFRVNECGLCVECEVHCWDWCRREPHYSQQSTSLLTLKGAFTVSLLTCLHLHIPTCWPLNCRSQALCPRPSTCHYPLPSFSWPFMVCLLTCAHLHIPCFWHLKGPFLKCCTLVQYWPYTSHPPWTVGGQISSNCPNCSLLSNTSSATELVSVTVKMEAAHSFQMSEQVPQGPSSIQQPLYKPENVHDNSCCHESNSCYWSRKYSFRGPKFRKGHVELAWECCMELRSGTVTVAMDTTVCWSWTLSVAISQSVCHSVWLS